jgi:catabolite regulation protein CreA
MDSAISSRFVVIYTCNRFTFSTAPSDASVACVQTTPSSFEIHYFILDSFVHRFLVL